MLIKSGLLYLTFGKVVCVPLNAMLNSHEWNKPIKFSNILGKALLCQYWLFVLIMMLSLMSQTKAFFQFVLDSIIEEKWNYKLAMYLLFAINKLLLLLLLDSELKNVGILGSRIHFFNPRLPLARIPYKSQHSASLIGLVRLGGNIGLLSLSLL